MTTGIRFPSDLPLPDRSDYRETFEEIRRSLEMESGTQRRRNRMRAAPRRFDLSFQLTQNEFAAFDTWWQSTIRGGEREFDIQLQADDAGEALVWYTVRVVDGVYNAEVNERMEYRVTFTVRAVAEGFATRISGTDELRADLRIGLQSAKANALIYSPYRADTSVGVTYARAVFNLPPLRGATAVGLLQYTRGRLLPRPLFGAAVLGMRAQARFDPTVVAFYPELSRQWFRRSWVTTVPAQDVNTAQEYQSREWMESN